MRVCGLTVASSLICYVKDLAGGVLRPWLGGAVDVACGSCMYLYFWQYALYSNVGDTPSFKQIARAPHFLAHIVQGVHGI